MVATRRPPIIVIAIGPQNTLRDSGIIARMAASAVSTTGRERRMVDSMIASHCDSIAGRQLGNQPAQIGENGLADSGRLHPFRDIGANSENVIAISPPENRILEIVVDARDLRERHSDAAASGNREVCKPVEVETFGRNRPRHDRDQVDALAVLGDLVA